MTYEEVFPSEDETPLKVDIGAAEVNIDLDASAIGTSVDEALRTTPLDVDVASTVHPAGLATINTGERAGSVTAVQLATVAAKFVRIKAAISNVGNVYVGTSASVTKAAGTTTTTAGFELTPGDDTGWMPAANLNLFWIICDNAGDDVTYMIQT